jgi:hypothetical protein
MNENTLLVGELGRERLLIMAENFEWLGGTHAHSGDSGGSSGYLYECFYCGGHVDQVPPRGCLSCGGTKFSTVKT